MPHYELLFAHDFTVEDVLREGDAFRYKGEVWEVERLEPIEEGARSAGETIRAYLRLWPNEQQYPPTIHGESA